MTHRAISTGVVFLTFALTFTGCKIPTIVEPVGTPWGAEELKELEGAWEIDKGDFLQANVGQDGKLYVAGLEFRAGTGKYEVVPIDVVFTRIDYHRLVFMKGPGGEEYGFARVLAVEPNQLRLAMPAPDVFVEAVQKDGTLGELVPVTEKPDKRMAARLTCDEAAFARILEEYGIERCFLKKGEWAIQRLVAHPEARREEETSILQAAAALAELGDFVGAEKLLEPHIADLKGPVVGPYAEAREMLRRMRLDYPLSEEQVLELIRKKIPDATLEDVERWREEGVLQHRVIDGEVGYFRREPSNLLRFSEDAKQRAGKQPVDPKRFDLPKHLAEVVELAAKADGPEVYPVRHDVTYKLTVSQGNPRIRKGAVVRCWLPFPKEYRQQKDVKLVSASPEGAVVAPNDQPQRTIYFEKTIEDVGEPLEFKAQFRFTTSAYVPQLDPAKAQQLDPSDPIVVEYTAERLPHIAFTPRVKEIVAEVAADEPNPLLRAKKLYLWVTSNMKYCAEREYGAIPSISDKGLTTGKGDCGVQGLVFITLCRAAGIPARWQSGFETLPRRENLHDWAEFYVAPWGWLPADLSYGLQKHDDPRVKEFYFGHLDPYRVIVNTDYARELYPPATSLRAEPNDFQRGEIEIDGHNLYFDEWDCDFDIETTPLK